MLFFTDEFDFFVNISYFIPIVAVNLVSIKVRLFVVLICLIDSLMPWPEQRLHNHLLDEGPERVQVGLLEQHESYVRVLLGSLKVRTPWTVEQVMRQVFSMPLRYGGQIGEHFEQELPFEHEPSLISGDLAFINKPTEPVFEIVLLDGGL